MRRVHHLEGGGHQPAGDDAAHRLGGVVDRVEVEQQGGHRRRVGREPDGDARRDAERALAPHEHAPEVEPGGLGVEAAEQGHRPVGEHDLQRQDVGAGHAVGQAVRPPGVVGHVAADGARLLARRVGREVEPVPGQRPGEVQVDDPRLHPGHPVHGVDLQDPVHLGGHDHHRVAHGHRPTGEARPRAPGHERAPVAASDPDACATSSVVSGKHTTAAAPLMTEASRP